MWIISSEFPLSTCQWYHYPLAAIDLCGACLCYGADCIYTFNIYSFLVDVKFVIFSFAQIIYQDNYEPYLDFVISVNNFIDTCNILYITYLSEYISACINLLPTLNKDHPAFQMYTWKPGVYLSNATFYYAMANNIPSDGQYNPYISDVFELLMFNETLHTACLSILQVYIFTYFIYIFFVLYLDVFGLESKKNKIIDQEFLTIQTGVLAEEELGSFDDKIFYYFFFFFLTGWFFLHAFYTLATGTPVILVYLWCAPVILHFLAYMPFNFLWNFGISFTNYLRGTGNSVSIVTEFMFDIICGVALFFRFFIQGIRLLLILFVYTSLHDLWLMNDWIDGSIASNESLLADLAKIELSFSSITYFIFIKIPYWIWYLIFETGHTFFVLTAQSFAFIAMIFWLFFFLYTCFTFDPMEEYLSYTRAFYKVKSKFFNKR